MNVSDILKNDNFKIITNEQNLDNNISGVYIGDLLSWVMGKAKSKEAWITIQGHVNIVAVAMLVDVACIIVAEGAEIDSETIKKANNEYIPILSTKLTSYEIAKLL